jgi:predicted transcriptional regulator
VPRRLKEKGYITHTIDGRTTVYEPAEARGKIAARAVPCIVSWICVPISVQSEGVPHKPLAPAPVSR